MNIRQKLDETGCRPAARALGSLSSYIIDPSRKGSAECTGGFSTNDTVHHTPWRSHRTLQYAQSRPVVSRMAVQDGCCSAHQLQQRSLIDCTCEKAGKGSLGSSGPRCRQGSFLLHLSQRPFSRWTAKLRRYARSTNSPWRQARIGLGHNVLRFFASVGWQGFQLSPSWFPPSVTQRSSLVRPR